MRVGLELRFSGSLRRSSHLEGPAAIGSGQQNLYGGRMSVSTTIPGIESLTLTVTQEIRVQASLQTTFETLLEQMGPENETQNGKMPMKLEAWPGGRWFRDLGDGQGHLWGHVQSIKRPTLLEITGPLFMS